MFNKIERDNALYSKADISNAKLLTLKKIKHNVLY